MGFFEDLVGGDVGKSLDQATGSEGVGGIVQVGTLGLIKSEDVNNMFKGPDMSGIIAAQEAQMQAELLRRSKLENLKDMQASQAAARSRQSFSNTNNSATDLNASSALNFIGL